MNNLQVTLTKTNGKMVFKNTTDETAYKQFLHNLPEGCQADLFLTTDATGKGTNTQIAKVHKSIRDLCNFTGSTFDEMKMEIKKRAGLYAGPDSLKSFADCSKDELNLAIQACIEVGDFTGINLR